MPEATVIKLSIQRMVCTGCGAEANASCNCGKPYVPKAVRAAEALRANPEKSDRSIADEIGASPTTIGKAREELLSSGQLEDGPRVGKDGKMRQARKEVSAAERKERAGKRLERRIERQAQQVAENFPHFVKDACDWAACSPYREDPSYEHGDDYGDLIIPESVTAETAAELLPEIEKAIENLKRLKAKLAEIAGGGNSALRVLN